MVRMYERRGEHKFTGYCCKTYKTLGKRECSRHAINDGRLQEAVLHSIQDEAGKIMTPEDIRYLYRIGCVCDTGKDYKLQAARLEKEIERREGYKKKTYQNYLDDVISKAEYLSYVKGYEKDIQNLKDKRKHLEERHLEENRKASDYDKWVESFKDYINVDKLTREMVLELIERIEVNEDGSVSIFYQFSSADNNSPEDY